MLYGQIGYPLNPQSLGLRVGSQKEIIEYLSSLLYHFVGLDFC